jgi:YD repeat-containing protein
MSLYDMGDSFTLRMADGRETALPYLEPGAAGYYDRVEQLSWRRGNSNYFLEDASGLIYCFERSENREGYRMLSTIATKDGHQIRFRYDSKGRLFEINDSRGLTLAVDTDREGHITCVSTYVDGEWLKLIRYRYDAAGNMVETTDAAGVSKHFEYKGHLLEKLTNQSGMSFYYGVPVTHTMKC